MRCTNASRAVSDIVARGNNEIVGSLQFVPLNRPMVRLQANCCRGCRGISPFPVWERLEEKLKINLFCTRYLG